MGRSVLQRPDAFRQANDHFGFFDDFNYFTDADLWTILDADAESTVGHEGAGRSRLKLLTSVDNEEAACVTTNELFKFVADKPISARVLINYTEVNTDDTSVAIGFANAMGADTIADDGASASINDSGALIYKLKNTTVWQFKTSIGGSAVNTESKHTAGGADQVLGIEIIPRSSTEFEAYPTLDGDQMLDADNNPIKHRITLGTATDMDFGLYIKGHHADDFTLYCDYAGAFQKR